MKMKLGVNGLYGLIRHGRPANGHAFFSTLRATAAGGLLLGLSSTLLACGDGEWESQPPGAATAEAGDSADQITASEVIPSPGAVSAEDMQPTAEAPPTETSTSETLSPPPRAGTQQAAAPDALSGDAEPEPALQPPDSGTMRTAGRRLFDSCGNPFVTRGVEQIFGEQLPQGNDWVGLVDEIALTGANAVRVLAGTDALGVDAVDAILSHVGKRHMVAYVTPYGNDGRQWLQASAVRSMLAKHERYIIIDAFGEPTFNDRGRFVREATAAIQQVRSWGYRVPLTATANQFGRDLPSLLELGAEIVASDPLHNTIMGWQAYWGSGGYYQSTYGMSLTEGVKAAAGATFPIQLGLDRITDFPSTETADFGALLAATESSGIGWLWWDWYNPYGNENNLTENGKAARLTATGQTVVETHASSIQNTSKLACSAPAPAGS
jgi:hypothetical protein